VVTLNEILEAIPIDEGFPRPDWSAVERWLQTHCAEEDREPRRLEFVREWIVLLKNAAGDGYEVFESESFLLLTPIGAKRAGNLVRVADRALQSMRDAIPGVDDAIGAGKFACLSFGDVDTYYAYVSHFYPDEGEFGASGGCYLSEGLPHFVLNCGEQATLEYVMVHELTHACLGSYVLPLWLEEGVTQAVEDEVLGSWFAMDRESLDKHRAYWTENGLRCFWWGRSFGEAGDGQGLSYALSRVFTRNLLTDSREKFLRLLDDADPLDCGDGAVRSLYRHGIEELAARFLGAGDWGWSPIGPEDFATRAGHHDHRGDYAAARADYEAAVDRGADDPIHLAAFAWLLSTCPVDDVRDGELAVTLATRARERADDPSPELLNALAAAHAERGDFDSAIECARHAIERLEASGGSGGGNETELLDRVQARKPYRDTHPRLQIHR